MKPYPEYKPTGLAWLPEIPKHWKLVRGKNLFKKANRPVEEGSEVITCFRDGEVTLRKNRRATGFTESLKEIGYQGIKKGDLVIHVMDAFAGAIGVSDSDGKGTPVYNVCIARTPDTTNNYYFAYIVRVMAQTGYIQSLYRGIRERSSDFRFEVFANQPLPFPPADEQAQIVRYLDAMTAKINKLIRAKKRQIALLQEQKQAIINQAVTRGLDPDVELKDSGIDWLGPIPKQWKLPHLAFFTTKIGSGKTPKGGAEIYQDSGVMFIRSQNVYFNTLQTEDISYISPEMDATMSNTRVYYEDVLLNITGGSIGRCCVYREHMPANVNQHVCIIRCKKSLIIPDYLANVLFSHVGQNSIMFCQNEGNRESLTFPQIGAFCVPLPDLGEQNDILKYLAKKTKSIDVAIDKINQEIQIFSELKNSYISFVVTGQVDVRNIAVEEVDPADLIAETDDDPTGEESPEESEE